MWATDLDEATVLEYSQTLGDLISQGGGGGSVIADSRGGFTTGKTHSATIPGNDITVSFDIFSGGVADPNGPYTVSNVGLGTPAFSLLTANGDLSLPGPADAPNCIILFQIQTTGGNSQWANASTASDGTWSISTGVLYNEALSGFFPYSGAPSATDVFDIVAICEPTLQKNIDSLVKTRFEEVPAI